MNKEFIKKMLKAERLKCEAIKEILPDKVREKADAFERDAFMLIKDIAVEIINEHEDKESCKSKKNIKKVDVDFSK